MCSAKASKYVPSGEVKSYLERERQEALCRYGVLSGREGMKSDTGRSAP